MKHKHKFYPTNELKKEISNERAKKIDMFAFMYASNELYDLVCDVTKRKWVCECGKIKWVREKD